MNCTRIQSYRQSSRKSKKWLKSFIPCDIGKYCWDKTIFRDENELIWDEPEEMIESNVEFQEEIEQKLTYGIDQMFIEEGIEDEEVVGNQEVEYFELVPVPDQMPDLVKVSKPQTLSKTKIQTTITFFLLPKNKNDGTYFVIF